VRRRGIERPDAGGVVGAAGREVPNIGRQQHTCDVGTMCGELADGDDGCGVVALNHAPYIDVALFAPR
jgi:hypothetical protein